ncbi:hypothetical protein [Parageobacillus thermoglucosidasius]|nr:hypothetical protein [Parageobacillus thermoglucosidasius]
MEWISFSFYTMLIGLRHGMDSDHIAAIADMVGAEKQKNQQLKLGMMYAVGHGAIVFVIGMLAIFAGTHLPVGFLRVMELFVGLSLLLLGMFILYSVVQQRNDYEYQGRWKILSATIYKLFRRKTLTEDKLSKFGIFGAFVIGVIHGIGAETPTQVIVISSSVGLQNLFFAVAQLLLFVIGVLMATIFMTYFASWGFIKAKFKKKLYLILGVLTGFYSVTLGISIIGGM